MIHIYDTEGKYFKIYRNMYFVCLIALASSAVPGMCARPSTVTVQPATAKLNEDALITYAFTTTLPGENVAGETWVKCDADGVLQGDPIITNLFNREPRGRYSISPDGYLIISNVKVNDTGYYLCRVTTSSGDNANGFSKLTVHYLDTPNLEPKGNILNENEIATFTCNVSDGVPTPITITWIKDGGVLCVSNTEKYPQSDTTLEISRVSEVDEGDYQCRVENVAYSGDEGKLSNKGTLLLLRPTSPSTTLVSSPSGTTSISKTGLPQKLSSSYYTVLVAGMTFVGFFMGILLSSIVCGVLWKMRNSKAQVTETTSCRDYELPPVRKMKTEEASRNDEQPSAYTAYNVEPGADNKYEDLQWNYDNPVVYVNVK
ncbi:hemicentin-1-like isoform X2 [Anneissia japonica]|uniref:hemicentin-1-like isoform X2 n=1 Tax=Anneissia japonica TaxID=1529436 RepID=UPI0014254C5F|nr:hemicentin-1-like isoform X2 [Anneissia japonica]